MLVFCEPAGLVVVLIVDVGATVVLLVLLVVGTSPVGVTST